MNLANEAGYLYTYSKELGSINKKLRSLSNKAEKHVKKHQSTSNEKKRLKHQIKHSQVTKKIRSLMKKHNKTITGLQHHHAAFLHALRKEHKIK